MHQLVHPSPLILPSPGRRLGVRLGLAAASGLVIAAGWLSRAGLTTPATAALRAATRLAGVATRLWKRK